MSNGAQRAIVHLKIAQASLSLYVAESSKRKTGRDPYVDLMIWEALVDFERQGRLLAPAERIMSCVLDCELLTEDISPVERDDEFSTTIADFLRHNSFWRECPMHAPDPHATPEHSTPPLF